MAVFASWSVTALGAPEPASPAVPGLHPDKSLEQYVLDSWTVDDGVPPYPIQELLRTRDGYLWLGTRGGVARFDGVRFVWFNMRNTDQFTSEDIRALAEGPDGALWIGTGSGGLLRFLGEDIRRYSTGDPRGDQIESVAVDRDGTVWIGTGNGLHAVRNDSLVPVHDEPWGRVDSIFSSADGETLFGVRGRGIFRYADGTFEALPTSGLPMDAPIPALLKDAHGIVWAGTRGRGLYRLDGTAWRPVGIEGDPYWRAVYKLYEDPLGSIWFTTDEGLFRYRDSGVDEFRTEVEWRTRGILGDSEGSLWVGTYQGLWRFTDEAATTFGSAEGFRETHSRAVMEDSRGVVWAGTLGGGLHLISNGQVRVFGVPEDFPSDYVWSFHEDGNGVVWVGTDAGLVRSELMPDTLELQWELIGRAQGVPPGRVRVVFEDPDDPGTFWLAFIDGGLARWQGGTGTTWTTQDGLAHDDVRWIGKASREPGDLWLGTQQGLQRFRDGPQAVYSTADGMTSSFITTGYEDQAGTLWLGSYGGGLMRFADGAFTAYTTREGLPSNDVWSIVEDETHLWWSNDRGIVRLPKADLSAFDQGRSNALVTRTFGRADGLRRSEVNGGGSPSAWRGRDALWFPSMAGAIRLDPGQTSRAVRPPPVVIEEVVVDGVASAPQGIAELGPHVSNLEIRYTALNLRDSEQLDFRYRLTGFDTGWIDAGQRRSAFYTKLPPGRYEFQVEARDGEVGSTAPATLGLVRTPHVTETRWFGGLVALALVLVILGAVQLRLRAVARHNLRLRAEVDQRLIAERQLGEVNKLLARANEDLEDRNALLHARNEEMESFTYTVSHDLKTPLVTIHGFVGLLREDAAAGNRDEMSEHIETIEQATERMERLLEELLELSRLGRPVTRTADVSIGELARDTVEQLRPLLDEAGVTVTVKPELPVVYADAPRLHQVFLNLIENAVKYMGDQSSPRIEIDSRYDAGQPVILVRDNGAGVDPSYHRKIFGLFEQLDGSSDGMGIGLALVERIVTLHGGRIWVESDGSGAGSTFCFTLGAEEPGIAANETPVRRSSGGR